MDILLKSFYLINCHRQCDKYIALTMDKVSMDNSKLRRQIQWQEGVENEKIVAILEADILRCI